jgi:hypothetical protein
VFTRHAEAMLVERGIDIAWVVRTLATPVTTEADPNAAHRMRAFAPVPERDGRILRVVYETDGDVVTVVTCFLDRGRR